MAKMWRGSLLPLDDNENGEREAEFLSHRPTAIGLRITPTEEEVAAEAAIPIIHLPPSAKQSTN